MRIKLKIFQGIYQIDESGGLLICDNSGKIMYVDENRDIVGLNYGVVSHSIISALGSATVNGKQLIYTSVFNNNYIDIEKCGLYFSPDEGKTWAKCATYEKPYYEKQYYENQRLFTSPLNNEVWHFIDGENSLYYSSDGKIKWDKVSPFSFKYSNDKITDFVFDPKISTLKYVCAGVNEFSLFRYDQKTNNRMDLKVEATKVVVARDDNKKLLTNTNQLSIDGGWTWGDVSVGIKKLVPDYDHQYSKPIYFDGANVIIYANTRYRRYENGNSYLLSSADLGKSWKIIKIFGGRYVFSIQADQNNTGHIYVISGDGTNIRNNNNLIVSQSLNRGGKLENVIFTQYSF